MDKVTPIGSPSRRKHRAETISRTKAPERWAKATEAYELRLAGKSPSEIAEMLGIAHVDDVYRLLNERFSYDAAYMTSRDRNDILGTELLRLEALQAAVWPSAMMGDPKAVDSAIKIIATRARIVGLDQADPVVQKNLVLVMGDKEEDYIAALKAAGAQRED